MKKVLLFFSLLSCTLLLNAQVGVNTNSPLGTFHVDGANNTGGTSLAPTNDSDDVIITPTGNMGIGTANPSTKLDVRGQLKITGGNPAQGRVLTSDANGLASWQTPGFSDFSEFTSAIHTVNATAGGSYGYTGYSVTLPAAGTYLVTFGARVLWGNSAGGTYPNRVTGKASYVLLRLSTNNQWDGPTPTGGYEVYATPARRNDGTNDCHDWRFYVNCNVTVTAANLTLYLVYNIPGAFTQIAGSNPAAGSIGEMIFTFGQTTLCPNCSGGSYTRVR